MTQSVTYGGGGGGGVCVCVCARARVLIVFTVALDFNKRCVEVVLKSKHMNRRNSDGPTIRLAQKEAYRLSATIKIQKTNRAHDVLQLLARKEEENKNLAVQTNNNNNKN